MLLAFKEVKQKADHHIILEPKELGDFASSPAMLISVVSSCESDIHARESLLLDDWHVHLGSVDFAVEFWRELGVSEKLLINVGDDRRHSDDTTSNVSRLRNQIEVKPEME